MTTSHVLSLNVVVHVVIGVGDGVDVVFVVIIVVVVVVLVVCDGKIDLQTAKRQNKSEVAKPKSLIGNLYLRTRDSKDKNFGRQSAVSTSVNPSVGP